MNQSILGALEAARTAPHKANPTTRTFVRICVCGHKEHDHGENIGGSFAGEFIGSGRTSTGFLKLLGCCGEPLPPKTKKRLGVKRWEDTEEFVPNPKKEGWEARVVERIVTCPCPEFRPVLEVDRPGARFNQWRPVDPPRSGQRDLNPSRHALIRGISATATWLHRTGPILAMERAGEPEEAIEARIGELLEERLRWLPDGQRCWAEGCRATDGVLPVYLDDDLSEMRCPEHRP